MLFLRLDLAPKRLDLGGRQIARIGENMRMAADQLGRDRLDHAAEIEMSGFLGHARMEDHLQQEVAKFVAQIGDVAAFDRIDDFIGLLDRIGRDRRESSVRDPRDNR